MELTVLHFAFLTAPVQEKKKKVLSNRLPIIFAKRLGSFNQAGPDSAELLWMSKST